MSMLTEEQLDLLFEDILNHYLENGNKEIHEVYNECNSYHEKFDRVGTLAELIKYDFYNNLFKFSNVSRDERLSLIFKEIADGILNDINEKLHKEYNECDTYQKKLDYTRALAKRVYEYELD